MQLSIVIPAHNEEHRIGSMLDAYLPYFAEMYGNEVEFIVMINGSTDATETVVARHGEGYPQVRTIVDPRQIGKGGALITAFQQAEGALVGFVDADGATPPSAFEALAANLGQADCIIASRWCRGAKVSPKQSPVRQVISRVFNLLTRILFGLKLTDTQCGAKLMRRDAILSVLPRIGNAQWAFDVDLLFQLRRAGYRVKEWPTEWHAIAGSKVLVIPHGIGMFAALLRLRLIYSPFKSVVKLYRPGIDIFHRFGPDEPGFGV